MEAEIESKINHHKVVNTYKGFEKWNDENLNIASYTIYNKITATKEFEVQDDLYDDYINRNHDSVLEYYRGDEKKIKGYI